MALLQVCSHSLIIGPYCTQVSSITVESWQQSERWWLHCWPAIVTCATAYSGRSALLIWVHMQILNGIASNTDAAGLLVPAVCQGMLGRTAPASSR